MTKKGFYRQVRHTILSLYKIRLEWVGGGPKDPDGGRLKTLEEGLKTLTGLDRRLCRLKTLEEGLKTLTGLDRRLCRLKTLEEGLKALAGLDRRLCRLKNKN
jgi:hypothetical protein